MTEVEGRRFWAGYEEFLDRIDGIGDDERTIAMMVYN